MFTFFVQIQKQIADLALSTDAFLVVTVKMLYMYLFAITVTFQYWLN